VVKLAPRTRFHLLVWVAWPVGGAVVALPAFLISPWFMIGFFLWAFYVQHATNNVRCPSCGNRVGFAKHSAWGLRHYFILPRHCEDCGRDLAKSNEQQRVGDPGGSGAPP
jgi:hypothetical protein